MIDVKHSRKGLIEGRTTGMGFAFLKKVGTPAEPKFETVQPVSCCKDYLNDVVYAEKFKKPITVYGLSYEPKSIFEDDWSYLTIKIQGPPNDFPASKADIGILDKNYKNIQKLLNHFEDQLNVKNTEITKDDNGYFIVKQDRYWSSKTYLISLYALLLRLGQYYTGASTPEEFINGCVSQILPGDRAMDCLTLKQVLPKMKLVLGGYNPEQSFPDNESAQNIHNYGICHLEVKL